jgi:hypothetical protein
MAEMKKLRERFYATDKECSAVLAILIALMTDNADNIMQAAADHLPDLMPYLSADAVRAADIAAFVLRVVLAVRKARSKEAA